MSEVSDSVSEGFNFTELSANDGNKGGFRYLDNEGLVNFADGVELTDVTKNYRDMLTSLNDFKE